MKIVKNPDGFLTKAAMMQGALAKERREEKRKQREANEREKKNQWVNHGMTLCPNLKQEIQFFP